MDVQYAPIAKLCPCNGVGVAGLVAITLLVSLLSGCSGSGQSSSTTINAATCSLTEVSTAVSSVKNGGTVVVPAGNCTWSSQLVIDKGLILRGAGIGQTVITSSINNQFGSALILYSPGLDEPFELSGFTLDGNDSGILLEVVSNIPTTALTKIKVHDNTFQNARSRSISMSGLEFGVFYNNQFLNNYIGIGITGARSSGWQFPQTLGGSTYPYFEDNTFTQTIARGGVISETGQGGRFVFRHNRIIGYGGNGGEVWDQHGNQGDRGTVVSEIYNNTVNLTVDSRVFNHRGGESLFFNNNVTGAHGSFNITEYSCWQSDTCTQKLYPKDDQINHSYYWNNRIEMNPQPLILLLPSYCCSRADCSCGGGRSVCGQFDDDFIQLNRDYWLPKIGLDTAKPVTCNIGEKFGATDTGKLYSCHIANVWTPQYEPYTYPHPLR